MNKFFLTAVTGLLISGCSAVPDDSRYVNTAMFSAVSDGAPYTVTASGLSASQSSQHVIQYSLRPNPGTGYRDKLDRLYATALMNINLSETSAGALVQVSGEIRYYDTEHYDNGKLTGDIIQTIPLTAQSIRLARNKPVTIRLPRDTLFVIELSTEQKMLNPALKVIPAAYKPLTDKGRFACGSQSCGDYLIRNVSIESIVFPTRSPSAPRRKGCDGNRDLQRSLTLTATPVQPYAGPLA